MAVGAAAAVAGAVEEEAAVEAPAELAALPVSAERRGDRTTSLLLLLRCSSSSPRCLLPLLCLSLPNSGLFCFCFSPSTEFPPFSRLTEPRLVVPQYRALRVAEFL